MRSENLCLTIDLDARVVVDELLCFFFVCKTRTYPVSKTHILKSGSVVNKNV